MPNGAHSNIGYFIQNADNNNSNVNSQNSYLPSNMSNGSENENKPHPPNHPYPNNTNTINTNLLSNQSFNQNHNSFYQSSALSSLVSENGGINSSNTQLKFKRFSDGSSNLTDTSNLNFIQQTAIKNPSQTLTNSDLSNLQVNNIVEKDQVQVHQP